MRNLEYLKNLNSAQKEAVISTDGPILVVAGAGSGKTKVLTSKIAHLIKNKKAFPNQILAVTFTNKAAKEMQNRVLNYVKGSSNAVPWLGTFHSLSAKILRKHASAVGLNYNFTIIDQDDQIRLIKRKSSFISLSLLASFFGIIYLRYLNDIFISLYNSYFGREMEAQGGLIKLIIMMMFGIAFIILRKKFQMSEQQKNLLFSLSISNVHHASKVSFSFNNSFAR